MVTDMTEGSPSRLLWKFSIPILFSVIFQQLYSIVDSIVAGKFIGDNALAAVGASYSITMIFMAVATGPNGGSSVVISQLFGGRLFGRMKEAISTALITVFITSISLSILGFLLCKPILRALQTPQEIFSDSMLYLNIYIAGLIFLFLYNICTGIFTALGDSRTPLYFLIASSLGNIGLDLLFVIVFKWGVAGVAWATFIAQGMASVLAFIVLLKRLKKIETEPYLRFSTSMLRRISRIAIPSILQASFVSVGSVLIQGIVNGFGPATIASFSLAIKLNTFAVTSFNTMASGLSSFAAQNMGANKPERVKKGFRASLVMAVCIIIPFLLGYLLFGPQIVGIFVEDSSVEVIQCTTQFLYIVSPFYFVLMFKLMGDSVLRGAGQMKQFMVTTFSDLIIRVILCYILAPMLGIMGIWLSWPIGWTIGTVLSYAFYKNGKWEKL